MDWLELNIDSYRIVAEILKDVRTGARRDLERTHGKSWYKAGLPGDLFSRLVERKERDTAIDWHDSEYQELMDFTSFADLIEILEHNPKTLSFLNGLGPSRAILHARFLELEMLRNKLAMMRPISETELSFLGSFHQRLRRAMSTGAALQDTPPVPDETVAEVEVGSTKEEAAQASPEHVLDEPAQSAPALEPAPVPDDAAPEIATAEEPTAAEPLANAEEDGAVESASIQLEEPARTTPSHQDRAHTPKSGTKTASRSSVDSALKASDHVGVLRELYREVTALAEGLWSRDSIPSHPVWDEVRVSSWYEYNFSARGLKPLSDFFELIETIKERMQSGASTTEIQSFLKDSNFAQMLLALRDMFQRNRI